MSQDFDRELARLWRVHRTIQEMISDRGYMVAEYEVMSFEDFKAQFGASGVLDRPSMCFTSDLPEHKGDRDRVYVYFCAERNVSKAAMKTFIGLIDKSAARRGIIVHPDKLGSAARKTLQEMSTEYGLEEFSESDLLVNITKHFLVPKHSIMSTEEKVALIKKYRLKETQLPRIMIGDPVARYYGVKRGQVMKIERASETAGRYITYRICM